MFPALLSAVAAASGIIVDKITLSRRNVPLNVFLPALFIVLFVLTSILVPNYGYVDWQTATLSNNLFLLLLMVVIAISSNVLIYQNLKEEAAHKHEVIMMLAPIVTITLAAIFFQEEFNLNIFILGLIASLSLLFARAEKRHFKFNKNSYNMLLAVVLISLEVMIIRELLHTFSPVSLFAFRTAFVALFYYLYYQPKGNQLITLPWQLILTSGILGVTQMVGIYYAFDNLGIIYTTLIMTLAPIIVFIGSWEILHEKIRPRVLVSALVIVTCVVTATVLTVK